MNNITCIFFMIILLGACSPVKQVHESGQRSGDGRYDSEFPAQSTSRDLYKMTRSVRLISSLTFYRSYSFLLSDAITENDLLKESFSAEKAASAEGIMQKPSSGTATIIFAGQKDVLVLTCAHVVYEADTLVTFFPDESGQPTPFVQTFSQKLKQTITVNGIPRGENPQIIALDMKKDLALVGKHLYKQPDRPLPVFPYKWGAARELQWGTFVYLLGFPNGKKMVSSALVSDPNRTPDHNFLIDASLHRGVSGGLVVALRDGPPHFEFVGVVNALAAQNQFVLRPALSTGINELNKDVPYKGDVYIDTQMSVSYGVTFAISVEAVKNFLQVNRKKLIEKGYRINIP